MPTPPIDQPAIEVTARQEGQTAIISVSDNGPGVPANLRENLFKAFQSSAKSGGNGLGLVIAAELCPRPRRRHPPRRHHGRGHRSS